MCVGVCVYIYIYVFIKALVRAHTHSEIVLTQWRTLVRQMEDLVCMNCLIDFYYKMKIKCDKDLNIGFPRLLLQGTVTNLRNMLLVKT